MALPLQVPAPKKPTKSYYTPDDKTSYSSLNQSVTYSKKQTHPTQLSSAHKSSRPVKKEPTVYNLASSTSKSGQSDWHRAPIYLPNQFF